MTLRRRGVWKDLFPGDSDLDITLFLDLERDSSKSSVDKYIRFFSLQKKLIPVVSDVWIIPHSLERWHRSVKFFDYDFDLNFTFDFPLKKYKQDLILWRICKFYQNFINPQLLKVYSRPFFNRALIKLNDKLAHLMKLNTNKMSDLVYPSNLHLQSFFIKPMHALFELKKINLKIQNLSAETHSFNFKEFKYEVRANPDYKSFLKLKNKIENLCSLFILENKEYFSEVKLVMEKPFFSDFYVLVQFKENSWYDLNLSQTKIAAKLYQLLHSVRLELVNIRIVIFDERMKIFYLKYNPFTALCARVFQYDLLRCNQIFLSKNELEKIYSSPIIIYLEYIEALSFMMSVLRYKSVLFFLNHLFGTVYFHRLLMQKNIAYLGARELIEEFEKEYDLSESQLVVVQHFKRGEICILEEFDLEVLWADFYDIVCNEFNLGHRVIEKFRNEYLI